MNNGTIAIGEILAGKRILFVGCTGFVGKVTLSMLLKRYPGIGRVHALVRPPVSGRSEDRFYGKIVTSPTFDPLHEEHQDHIEEFLRSRVDVISGDATRLFLGLDEPTLARLSGKVDVVLNCAGMVRFTPPLEQALNVNTLGVARAVEVAHRVGAGLVHVSTCFVAGRRSGEVWEDEPVLGYFPLKSQMPQAIFDHQREIADCQKLIADVRGRAEDAAQQARFRADAVRRLDEEGGNSADERAVHVATGRERKQWIAAEMVRVGAQRSQHWGWDNTYCYTKALGEQIAAASGVPFALVRPAIVESSLAYPFPGWNEGFTTSAPLAFLSLKGHRLYPAKPGLILDLVPVDMVAAALIAVLAATIAKKQRPVYQLGSGDSNPLTMSRCVELLGICKRRDFRGRRFGNKLVNRLQSRLETVPVSRARWERSIRMRRRALSEIDRLLERAAPRWGGPRPGGLLDRAREALHDLGERGRQVDEVLELFLPFVHENAYVFRCEAIRELFASMSPRDRALISWAPEKLVWRDYWIDVHMEGLKKWIFPSLERELEWKPKHVYASRDLLEMLDNAVRRHGGRVALRMSRGPTMQRTTYAELGELTHRGAAGLCASGVKPGDRVLLASENRPEWPMAYFSVLRAGGVCVPIDAQATREEVANLVRSSGARAAVLSGKCSERFPGLTTKVLRFSDLFDGPGTADAPVHSPKPDDLASLIFTSGTTGKPKAVMLSHRNFTSLVSKLAGVFEMGPGDGMLSLLPLHHTFEFSCGLLMPLSRGAEINYLEEVTPEALSAALSSGRISLLIGVPAVWQALHRRVMGQLRERGGGVETVARELMSTSRALRERTGVNVGRLLFWPIHRRFGGRLRYLISGGSALPPAILEDFLGMGFTLYEGYGLTEAAPVLTVNRPGGTPLGVGEPLPGIDVEIRDADESGVGEVVARGPNVMPGYFEDPAATRSVIHDGWLHTGDLGRMEGKRLVIVGRKKDVIIDSNGRNVYPDELEDVVGESQYVKELSIVGLPDDDGGEKVACLAVPASVEGLSEEDVRARVEAHVRDVNSRLPFYRRVKVLHVWQGELPRTATRKVKRRFVVEQLQRLERRVTAERGQPGADDHRASEDKKGAAWLMDLLVQITGKPRASISMSARLVEDLGFDSLLYAELLSGLEGAGVDLPATDDLTGVRTVAELWALAASRTPRETSEAPAAAAPATQTQEHEDVEIPAPLIGAGRKVLRMAQRFFYERFFDVRVTGRSYIPRGGGFLVVANHSSHLDMGLAKHALGEYGEHVAALAARDYFFDHPLRRAYFSNFTNLLPMEREGSLKESLRLAGNALKQGRVLLLFPEGTRSPSGEMQEFKASLGYLALAHGVAVLPMWLEGTHRSLPKGAALPRTRQLEVRIGPALTIEQLRARTEGLPRSEAYRVASRLAQEAVEALRDGRSSPMAEQAGATRIPLPVARAKAANGKHSTKGKPAANGKHASNGKSATKGRRDASAKQEGSRKRRARGLTGPRAAR